MKTYLFTFSLSLLLAMGCTPILIALARRHGWVDVPNARSVHDTPVARVGGIAIFLAAILATLPVLFIQNAVGESFRGLGVRVAVLLFGGAFMFFVGLWDDLHGIRVRTKLAAQTLAALVLLASGVRVTHITVEGLFTLELGVAGWILAAVWIVGITNAVNLADGLDGLAAGLSAIACAAIAILAIMVYNSVMAILMLALLGALCGFLVFNFSPARIFMGDSGSLFIGYLIAGASLMTAGKSHALVGIAMPILVLGIPIFDTFFSMLRRFLQRRGVMSADRGHFHHRLLDLGFSQHQAAILAYLVTAIITGLGFFMVATRSAASVTVFLCCLLILLLVFRLVGAVRLRETLTALQVRSDLSHRQRIEKSAFEDAHLHMERVQTFDQWWQALCVAAEKLDVDGLALELRTRSGEPRRLVWARPGSSAVRPPCVDVQMPIPDRRADSKLQLQVRICSNGSLESAGRRMTYLARLLEEGGLARLRSAPQSGADANRGECREVL